MKIPASAVSRVDKQNCTFKIDTDNSTNPMSFIDPTDENNKKGGYK